MVESKTTGGQNSAANSANEKNVQDSARDLMEGKVSYFCFVLYNGATLYLKLESLLGQNIV